MKKYIPILGYAVAVSVAVSAVSYIVDAKFAKLSLQNQTYQFTSVQDQKRQLQCMAENIYYEAATEPPEGKIAVAQVVMNRVAHPDFPKDPCRVIHQKNLVYERVVCQFSWLCEKAQRNRKVNPEMYRDSYDAATMVMLEGMRLPSLKEALYYHADYVNPQWKKTRVAHIGRHIFYKP